jgi:carbamoylphosphate synthase large subunit
MEFLKNTGVEMIGANKQAIDKAEDRELFRQAMLKIGLDMPKAAIAHSLEDALKVQEKSASRQSFGPHLQWVALEEGCFQ